MCVEFCVRVCKLHAAFEFLLRSGSGPSAGKEGERPPPRPHSSCLRLGVPGLCPALGQSSDGAFRFTAALPDDLASRGHDSNDNQGTAPDSKRFSATRTHGGVSGPPGRLEHHTG